MRKKIKERKGKDKNGKQKKKIDKKNLPGRYVLERHCSAVKYLNPHTVNAAQIGLVMSVYLAPTVHSVLIKTACICPF